MAKIKGPILVSLKKFVLDRFGKEGLKKFLESFPEDERNSLEMPLALGWYDLSLVIKALHHLKDVLGKGNRELVRQFGYFDVEQDLNFFQRVFLSLANPAYALEKSAEYWSRFCDWGNWKVTRIDKNHAKGELIGCPIIDGLYCLELTSYLYRMWELIGARDINISHEQCRARGDKSCIWSASWR